MNLHQRELIPVKEILTASAECPLGIRRPGRIAISNWQRKRKRRALVSSARAHLSQVPHDDERKASEKELPRARHQVERKSKVNRPGSRCSGLKSAYRNCSCTNLVGNESARLGARAQARGPRPAYRYCNRVCPINAHTPPPAADNRCLPGRQ